LIVKFRFCFLRSVFVRKQAATHLKILLFSDSFVLWSQATEVSCMVDCSVVVMRAIEKSKFFNAFFVMLFGGCVCHLF